MTSHLPGQVDWAVPRRGLGEHEVTACGPFREDVELRRPHCAMLLGLDQTAIRIV